MLSITSKREFEIEDLTSNIKDEIQSKIYNKKKLEKISFIENTINHFLLMKRTKIISSKNT